MSYVVRENLEDVYALSPIQEGIFFHASLEPELAPYLEQALWSVEGHLDAGRFCRAWALLVARHPILRTVFRQARKGPVQIVLRRRPASVAVVDLGTLSPAGQGRAIRQALADDLARGVDLAHGPLSRLVLMRLAPRHCKLLWTFSHIILDGWTLPLLLGDFLQVYDALVAGAAPPAAAFPPYREHIAWLGRQDRGEALGYWRRQLQGFTTPTALPVDRRTTTLAGRRHGARHVFLGAASTAALGELARRRGATLSTALAAGWAVLLERYTGERDVVFGLTVSGRPVDLPGADRMLGPFINTLPLRARLEGDPAFVDLLHDLQQQTVNMNHYSYVPLPEVQACGAVRAPRRLFDSVFNFQRRSDSQLPQRDDLRLRTDLDAGGIARTNYELLIDTLLGEELCLWLSFVEEAFDATTVERLAGHYRLLLEGIARNPEAALGELELLSADERRQILEVGRATEPAAPGGFAHELFIQQAAACPDAAAVLCEDRLVTYGELGRRVHRLAHWLRAQGVRREDRVAVFGRRGVGMLTAILGILEAGAAYVPLDPEQPDSRIASILSAAGLAGIATQGSLAQRAAGLAAAIPSPPAIFCWGSPPRGVPGPEHWRDGPTSPLGLAAGGDGLAYVFFTSGSTGKPKGAMVEHSGMANHLQAKIDLLALDASCTVAQNASHCFDISVWQFLAPLAVGGRVVIYGDETALDPVALLASAERDQVTVLETVPSLLEALLEAVGRASATGESLRLPRLRFLLSTGEALPVALGRRWLQRFPEIPLANVYGPTECSDDITHHLLTTPPSPEAVRIPVGRPVRGMRIDVLDRRLRPAPLGCAGQVVAAGAGLGRGYLGKPGPTAAVFVPDAAAESPGDRLYLTGDLGRWTAAGVLEYLGRLDHQVKVRGNRIELGEIEAALARHPGVRQAVVVALPDSRGDNRLVAYRVGDEEVAAAEMRVFLARWLPRYMIPEAIVTLSEMPLNRSGKVDRKRLPPPPAPAAEEGGFTAPRNELEARIAAVWRDVLGVERVGIHDDFFALGGHSLKTIRVRARLSQELALDIPLRTVFGQPTIAEQASAVGELLAGPEKPSAGRLPRLSERPHYPLSHAQRRLWYLSRAEPENVFYNLSLTPLIEGPFDLPAFHRAMAALLRRHAALRTRFVLAEGEPVQILSPAGPLPLVLCDLSGLGRGQAEPVAARLLAAGVGRPFDLQVSTFRYFLVRLDPERHLPVLVLHHIVTDGWSGVILLRDLARLFAAERAGEEALLPELTCRYVDYASWHNERLASGALAADERYWLDLICGDLPELELPADRPVGAPQTAKAVLVERLTLPQAAAGRLRQLGREAEATPFVTHLALLMAFLYRITGQEDLIVGTPVAGRDHPDAENLVGFFVNIVPVRARLGGDLCFPDVLAQVKEAVVGALAHGEFPFDLLVQRVNPARGDTQVPLVKVLVSSGGAEAEEQNETMGFSSAEAVLGSGGGGEAVDHMPGVGITAFSREDPAGGLAWLLLFTTALFEPTTARRLAHLFAALMRAVAGQPDAVLGALPLLSAREQHQLTSEWNDAPAEGRRAECFHHLFASWASQAPERVAVAGGDEHSTYGELDGRAGRMARELRSLGVGAERPVGVFAGRSVAQMTAFVATLKAGGVYLPLDPDYPQHRLAWMLEDAAPALVVAEEALAGRLPAADGIAVVELAALGRRGEGGEEEGATAGGSLAYVIYTSGSTGRPKGVMVSHRSLVSCAEATRRAFAIGGEARVMSFSPLSFDGSLLEFLLAWSSVATLELAPAETRWGGAPLARFLRERSIEALFLPPSALGSLPRLELPALETMLIGGEVLPPELIERWEGGRRFFNAYGPTETTVVATRTRCRAAGGKPSIGRPLCNLQAFVLAAGWRLAPTGVAGELVIGGEGVARGYLKRPRRTAASFVPDQVSGARGARLYRTGDRARMRSDGEIDFLGRLDQQVKLRGLRIELGEVEAALSHHPAVAHCTVAVQGEGLSERRLVAYLMEAPGAALPPGPELRAFLARTLPGFMVPQAFVQVASLPMTPSGKLDRRALPAWEGSPTPHRRELVPPRDEVEMAVARIWEEVLGQPAIGVTEDFFELGGHSLMAVALLARLEERFGTHLSIRELLLKPTVAGVSLVLRAGGAERRAAQPGPVLLEAGPSGVGPLFLAAPHGGTVFCYHALARSMAGKRPIYGLQAPGFDEGEEPAGTIEEMARRHLRLVRQVWPRGAVHLAGWSFGGPVVFEMARQLEEAGEEVGFLGIFDTAPPDALPRQPGVEISIGLLARAFFGSAEADFTGLDEDQALLRFIAEGQRLERLPPGIDLPAARRIVSVIRANTLALRHYAPSGRIRAGIHLFVAEAESYVPDPGDWVRWTQGEVRVIPTQGDHHTLLFAPAVERLAAVVRGSLGDGQPGAPLRRGDDDHRRGSIGTTDGIS